MGTWKTIKINPTHDDYMMEEVQETRIDNYKFKYK